MKIIEHLSVGQIPMKILSLSKEEALRLINSLTLQLASDETRKKEMHNVNKYFPSYGGGVEPFAEELDEKGYLKFNVFAVTISKKDNK